MSILILPSARPFSVRVLCALALGATFAPAALADTCAEFANETVAWLESGPGHIVRTAVTARIDGGAYEGFTFAEYTPATSGRFALAGALFRRSMPMKAVGASTPAFDMSWRLTLIDDARVSARNLTEARPLGFVTASSCERIPSLAGWRVEAVSPTTGNEILFEMAYDSRPL